MKTTLLILIAVISLSSCSMTRNIVERQKQLMAQHKRDQAYLRYYGNKKTGLQKIKENQVATARKLRALKKNS
jgi:cytochrome c biogenesis protein ResB